jgi:hypothetical protein
MLLPFHFGMAGLGSAAAVLIAVGFREPALNAIFIFAAAAETLVQLYLEIRKHGAVDRALHEGKSGWLLRIGEALSGVIPLILALMGFKFAAAISFLAGALLARFGWLSAGRTSACDPESVFASQRGSKATAKSSLPYNLHPAVASTGSLKKP